MKDNLEFVIKKCISFLNKSYTQEQIQRLVNHLSVDSMRNNPSCNNDILVQTTKLLNNNNFESFRYEKKLNKNSIKTQYNNNIHIIFLLVLYGMGKLMLLEKSLLVN